MPPVEINLAYYQEFVEELRPAIAAGRFGFYDMAQKAWRTGETKPICLSGAESNFG